MPKPQILVLDDFDSRRELHYLLNKLPPVDRVLYLRWACGQVPTGPGKLPAPVPGMFRTSVAEATRCDRASTRLTNEVYTDILALLNQYGADAVKLAVELERRVRALRR